MKTIKRLACILLSLGIAFISNGQATGATVKKVNIARQGEFKGAYLKRADGKWVRTSAEGKELRLFNEMRRDHHSVFLKSTRNEDRVQLDLYKKVVFYTRFGHAKQQIYRITNSFAHNNVRNVVSASSTIPKKVNGKTVTYAVLQSNGKHAGYFKKVGPNLWTRQIPGKRLFRFTEQHRIENIVLLFDKERNIRATLNLTKKTVSINNRPMFTISYADARSMAGNKISIDKYAASRKGVSNGKQESTVKRTIERPKNQATGRNVIKVSFGENNRYLGNFEQMVSGKRWYVKTPEGHVVEYYNEVRRDDWSVYLKSNNSSKTARINLQNKKITIQGETNKRVFDVRKCIARQ